MPGIFGETAKKIGADAAKAGTVLGTPFRLIEYMIEGNAISKIQNDVRASVAGTLSFPLKASWHMGTGILKGTAKAVWSLLGSIPFIPLGK